MFKFLSNIFSGSDKADKLRLKENFEFANRVRDKHLRYICERFDMPDGNVDEIIIGREGFFNINDNAELEIYLAGISREIFRARIADLQAGELMSLEGAVIEAFDLSQNKPRKIIAYYKYYR